MRERKERCVRWRVKRRGSRTVLLQSAKERSLGGYEKIMSLIWFGSRRRDEVLTGVMVGWETISSVGEVFCVGICGLLVWSVEW